MLSIDGFSLRPYTAVERFNATSHADASQVVTITVGPVFGTKEPEMVAKVVLFLDPSTREYPAYYPRHRLTPASHCLRALPAPKLVASVATPLSPRLP